MRKPRNAAEVAEYDRGFRNGGFVAEAMAAQGDVFAEDMNAMARKMAATRDTPFAEGFEAGYRSVARTVVEATGTPFAYPTDPPHPACTNLGGHGPHMVTATVDGARYTGYCDGYPVPTPTRSAT
jgi:hypothetical protein